MFAVRCTCSGVLKLRELLGNTFTRSYFEKNKFNQTIFLRHNAVSPKIFIQKAYFCDTVDTEENKNQPEINYEAITNGDKDLEHKLKVIILEAEVMRQEGKLVPPATFLTEEHWKECLSLPSLSARRKYFQFLFKLCMKRENFQRKKEEKRIKLEARDDEKPHKYDNIEEFASNYNLRNNNVFLRFYDSTMHQMYNNRLVQAMRFGQKIVVDCSFDSHMVKRENINCAKQLMIMFAENRLHDEPFDLHFCGANKDGELVKYLHRFIPTMYEPDFPLNIHECNYLDLFPKEKLVYLTPHCKNELLEFDHDALYIIGAIVDKVNTDPVTLAKAKREGLKMAKLPFDRYLQWGSGSGKVLTLNQIISILLDVKMTGDWMYSLRHVPRRKLVNLSHDTDISQYNNLKRERQWTPNATLNNSAFNKPFERKEKETAIDVKNIMSDW